MNRQALVRNGRSDNLFRIGYTAAPQLPCLQSTPLSSATGSVQSQVSQKRTSHAPLKNWLKFCSLNTCYRVGVSLFIILSPQSEPDLFSRNFTLLANNTLCCLCTCRQKKGQTDASKSHMQNTLNFGPPAAPYKSSVEFLRRTP